jgi:glycosyltransferase involved in cell wall biosynthesis
MSCHLKISVVIATLNNCEKLKVAIKSVLEQELMPDQTVVLDDGSTDDTVSYLESLQQTLPNLKWRSQTHSGIGVARKQATIMADGDVIAVLDSDDILYPYTISRYKETFENNPGLDLVYGNVAVLDPKGKKLGENRYKTFKNNSAFKKAIFLRPQIPFKHSAIAFRKKSYFEIGGYDEKCDIKVDIDLILKFIQHNKTIKHLDEILAGHRVHKLNMSRNRFKGLKKWYTFIFAYEKNLMNKIFYTISKTIWESSKVGVETVRSLAFAR